MNSPIIRAIDLGYGGTKFTINDTSSSNLMCGLFPSVAALKSATDLSSDPYLQKRECVIVDVNNKVYEVGPDVMLANDGLSNRNLHTNYIREDSYRALMYGALSYMEVEHIDLLVLGLPVKGMKKQEELKQMFIGTHNLANNKTININDILVVAQPIGGFIDFAVRENLFNKVKNETNLLIDMGFYTLDWMVAHGLKPVEHRCSSEGIGVSHLLKMIEKPLADDVDCDFDDINVIDDAVRTGIFQVGRESYDMNKYIPAADGKIDQALTALRSSIKKTTDIQSVILSGGGSNLIIDKVRDLFPKHDIVVSHDPVFSNVRGFQYAGELRMRNRGSKVA